MNAAPDALPSQCVLPECVLPCLHKPSDHPRTLPSPQGLTASAKISAGPQGGGPHQQAGVRVICVYTDDFSDKRAALLLLVHRLDALGCPAAAACGALPLPLVPAALQPASAALPFLVRAGTTRCACTRG